MTTIFVAQNEPQSIVEIAQMSGVSQRVALLEVDRLLGAGLIVEKRVGRARLIAPNESSPEVPALKHLLEVAFGPEPRLREILSGIEGIDAAYIYGSWAERRLGKPGQSPKDIDVLIVGTVDEDDVERQVRPLQKQLGRTVSITVVSPQRWQDPASTGFLPTVRSKPIVTLLGDPVQTSEEGKHD